MKPLIVLAGTFTITLLILKILGKKMNYSLAGRLAMLCMLTFTAIGHFAFMDGMQAMVPTLIPFKKEIVFITGIMEIVFGTALLFPQYQKQTGWLLIAFFILILPANINAALHQIHYQTGSLDGPRTNYLWFRVPLQLFFMVWVYLSTNR